jgi:hypothetical protein
MIRHLPALKHPPGHGQTTITTKPKTKAILPAYEILVKKICDHNFLKNF